MKKNHILSLDIAQNGALVQLQDADGKTLWTESLAATQEGWERLKEVHKKHCASWKSTFVIMEATGVHHHAWACALREVAAQVHVLNPLLASRMESMRNALRGHKTDPVDVARLAETARLYAPDLKRFAYTTQADQLARRQLQQVRHKLRELLTNIKKSLGSHLELTFPALLQAKIKPDCDRGLTILRHAGSAGAWLKLPEAQRLELAGAQKQSLDQACQQTLANEPIAQACQPAIALLLQTEQALQEQLDQCDEQLAARSDQKRVALITSIPGFGPRTSIVLDVYLPDSFQGWGKKKKITARLQALFGVDPRLQSSGQWIGKIKMSKRGIGSARTALYQSAFCSTVHDPENKAYYQSLRARGKNHKQALVDVMRKQLRRLVAVLTDQRPFIPNPITKTPCPA